MEKDKDTTDKRSLCLASLHYLNELGITPEDLIAVRDDDCRPQNDAAKSRSDETTEPVLIKDPDGTLNDTKRFMWELSEAILQRHHKALKLHSLREAVDWIFAAEHEEEDPFYRECLIAEEIRNGGRKRKSKNTMYIYARQGGMSSPSVAKRIVRSRQEARREAYRKELAELAKLDPVHIY